MKDVLDVLRTKEREVQRVRKEIEAVRLAAVLMLIADDNDLTSVSAPIHGATQVSRSNESPVMRLRSLEGPKSQGTYMQ